MPDLSTTVRHALTMLPGPLNELARVAGVSQALLWRIRSGERAATPEVARKLVDAAAKLAARRSTEGREYRALAAEMRRALPRAKT